MIIKYRAFPFLFMLQEQVIYKVPLTAMMLKDAIQTIRGSIMICYPMGLPSYDPVQQAVVGTAKLPESLDPDTAHIWWAGKELMRNKCLQDHIGKNEKTKVYLPKCHLVTNYTYLLPIVHNIYLVEKMLALALRALHL
jgi:hypothetical protein